MWEQDSLEVQAPKSIPEQASPGMQATKVPAPGGAVGCGTRGWVLIGSVHGVREAQKCSYFDTFPLFP